MKRFMFIIACLACCATGMAQEKTVRMPETPKQERFKEFSREDKGYWWSVDLGIAPSLKFHETSMWSSTLSFVNGYRFNDYLKVGIGIGAGYYFANSNNLRDTDVKWTMPVFLNARGNFVSQNVREIVPFWSVDLGAAFRDGFLFTPSFGCRIGERRSAFLVSLGYSLRGIDNKTGLGGTRNFIVLKVGYEF